MLQAVLLLNIKQNTYTIAFLHKKKKIKYNRNLNFLFLYLNKSILGIPGLHVLYIISAVYLYSLPNFKIVRYSKIVYYIYYFTVGLHNIYYRTIYFW
jgi:hypothetical protein